MHVTARATVAVVLLAIFHPAAAQLRCGNYYDLCNAPEVCTDTADSFECRTPDPRCGQQADFINEANTFRCDCTRGTRQCFYDMPPVPVMPGNSSFGSATSTTSPAEFPSNIRNREWIT
eukprot:1972542-Rhodomonas_salina.1